MGPTFWSLSVGFVVLTLVFWGIEYFWPSIPEQRRLRGGFVTDVVYWLFTPLHANVSWTFGPLGHVLASPAFHRRHHTKETAAIDKNFAGLLPVWDLLFGTFYLPKDRRPTEFGVHDDGVPDSFWGQLVYPFRKAS